jgi:cell fate regulator YaaT (PSP1 superfamily)
MIRLVSIKFRAAGRQYDFGALDFDLRPGDRVIVETDRGRALGTVVTAPRDVPRSQAPDDVKNVLRLAAAEDIALADVNTAREGEAIRFCQKRVQERRMEMKLVRAEYLFDGSKIIFYFTADGRIDFRELVKDLAHHFHTRIEMRQIGVRDEAKLTGGIGICGRELCCCTFLTEFAPVSVKMAKEQGLALNPNKISGQCGRLLCCLGYEFETYCALKKGLPKCGKKITLENREVEVVAQNILRQSVNVRLEDGKQREVTAEQLEQGLLGAPPPSTPPPGAGSKPSAAAGRTGAAGETPSREGRPGRPQGSRPQPQRAPSPRPQPQEAKPQEAKPQDANPLPPAEPGESGMAPAAKSKRRRHRGRRRPQSS